MKHHYKCHLVILRVMFVIVATGAWSCKQGDDTTQGKSLDHLIGAELQPNQCGINAQVTTNWDIDVVGYKGQEDLLRQKAMRALSAAPPAVQGLFKKLLGKVMIVGNPLDFCPGFSSADKTFANGFICWNYEASKASSSLNGSQVSNASEPARPFIAVSGEKSGMYLEHGLLRALGYLFVSKFVELNVSQAKVTMAPFHDPAFERDLVNLSLAVLQDVAALGIDTRGTLFETALPENFVKYGTATQKQLLESDDSDALRYAKHVLFAETFDSFYCNQQTRSNMTKDNRFRRSYDAFLTFDTLFNALQGGSYSLHGQGKAQDSMALTTTFDMGMLQPLMTILQSLMGLNLGGINPNLNGMNNGLGGLQSILSNNNNGLLGMNSILPLSPPLPGNSLNSLLGGGSLGGGGSSGTASVISESNKFRASQGVPALREDPELTAACLEHSKWMSDNNSMQHYNTRPDYPGPRNVAENIGSGYQSPEAAVNGWINSPGHRANLVNSSYTTIGAANTGTWWCQQFR